MKEINVKELKELIDSGADLQLIDVRETWEHELANIGGDLIPMNQVTAEVDKFSRDKQVVVYCRSGRRSANVIMLLEKLHQFENLYNLEGGILAWSDEIDPSIPTY